MDGTLIFNEWAEDLPHERKVQVAEELLLISGSDKLTPLTPEEQKIVEEAEKFLLQRD